MNLTPLSPVSLQRTLLRWQEPLEAMQGQKGPGCESRVVLLWDRSAVTSAGSLCSSCRKSGVQLGTWPQPRLKVPQACRGTMGSSFLADTFPWSTCTFLTVVRRHQTASSHDSFSGSREKGVRNPCASGLGQQPGQGGEVGPAVTAGLAGLTDGKRHPSRHSRRKQPGARGCHLGAAFWCRPAPTFSFCAHRTPADPGSRASDPFPAAELGPLSCKPCPRLPGAEQSP